MRAQVMGQLLCMIQDMVSVHEIDGINVQFGFEGTSPVQLFLEPGSAQLDSLPAEALADRDTINEFCQKHNISATDLHLHYGWPLIN